MYKLDSERDEPPEWWELAYDWDVDEGHHWYCGDECSHAQTVGYDQAQ